MKEIQSNISWDELFMRHAYLISYKSKDPRTKIGAVLVKDGVVISEGYNGFARGVKDYEERYLDRETKYAYVTHGEANTVLNCARRGVCTLDSICYTQAPPCQECMKILIQAGVKEVVCHSKFPGIHFDWSESCKIARSMAAEAGVKVRFIDNIIGMKAYAVGTEVDV